jgi:hypothetical protein
LCTAEQLLGGAQAGPRERLPDHGQGLPPVGERRRPAALVVAAGQSAGENAGALVERSLAGARQRSTIMICHPIYDAFPWRVVGLWLHNTEKLHDQAGLLAGGPAN